MIARVWRCKWNLARLVVAGVVLWALLVDTGPRLARLGLASLPDFDFAQQVAALRAQGRYGEAMMVGEAGLARYSGATQGEARSRAIADELAKTREEQGSLLRRARDVGLGALTGQGTSLEGLIGAVGSDLLVVGDVRDLVIQAMKLGMDGEVDPVITALSSAGIVLTVAPEIDWGVSLMKVARKTGAMTRGLTESVLSMVRRGSRTEIEALAGSVGRLSQVAGPGSALRMLRSAESAEDVAKLAGFTQRQGARGAAALHIAGDEGARWVTRAAASGGEAEILLIKAADKGPAGVAFAKAPSRLPLLLRPHPLLGLTKGLYKGNVTGLVSRVLDAMGAAAFWLLPLVVGWVVVELWWLGRRWGGGGGGEGALGRVTAGPAAAV